MTKIQAYCGIDCGECEAYIATQANDRAGLEATAKKWAEQYGGGVGSWEACVCDGCSSGRRTSAAHAATCAIRVCASGRGVMTCAHCADYGCATLQQFFAFAPSLKEKLEVIRKGLGK
ncbi:MAG: DUF3795 domain-containing protein [Candidatus Aminicenantes bacterium]|nr:DUF3795 domain-containing protein [Candidatus Aminicenantes bacterium]